MSSLLRSLRPTRNELKKLMKDAPVAKFAFESCGARDEYHVLLEIFIKTLRAQRMTFFTLHEKLIALRCDSVEDQKSVDEMAEADATLLLEVDACLQRLEVVLQHLVQTKQSEREDAFRRETVPAGQAQPSVVSVKLPKIDMKKFYGDFTQWKEFWDSFYSAVHSNRSLSTVDKFNYLKGLLAGEAKTTVSGLSLTEENYQQAVDILQRRFGNQQAIINSHYAAITNLPPAPDQTFKVRNVVDSLEKHIRSLEALGQDMNHGHFISLILSKLPREFIIRLEERRGAADWTVAVLRQTIQQLLAAREVADQHHRAGSFPASKPPQAASEREREHSRRSPHFSTTGSLMTNASSKSKYPQDRGGQERGPGKSCVYCQDSHWSDECPKFPTVEARKKELKGKCFVCLKPGHGAAACRRETTCPYCKARKKHHRSLCVKKFSSSSPKEETVNMASADTPTPKQDAPPRDGGEVTPVTQGESTLAQVEDRGLLQSAVAKVSTCQSKGQLGIAMHMVLDSGSQRTYITTAMAKALNAPIQKTETLAIYTFGSSEPKHVETQVVKVQLHLLDGSTHQFTAHTVATIGEIHHPAVDIGKYGALYKTLPLANPVGQSGQKRTIDLLIGNNYYYDLVTSERIELSEGLYLIGSKLGWIIAGRVNDSVWKNTPSMVMLTPSSNGYIDQLPYVEADPPLLNEVSLEDWWSLETMGIKDSAQDPSDAVALKTFLETVKYENQRYFVTWPWKQDAPSLPDNYYLAFGRLRSLLRRLQGDQELLRKYDEIIQQQMKNGIIEPAPPVDDEATKKHYIPHHPVVTPDKATTKVRIVYDGSAKLNRDSPSINECLFRGPVLLDDVGACLIRFRLNAVGLVADIEKAFLQVGLQERERDVTRFLWLKDPNKLQLEDNIQIYRFARVPFGIVSSPFLLGATIQHHLSKQPHEIAKTIARDIYVDNLVTGTSSTEHAVEFYKKSKAIFQSASMNLREWGSNDPHVMKMIPEADRLQGTSVKVLGVTWDMREDILHLAKGMPDQSARQPSKRAILRSIARIFDPLGVISPALIDAKLFLQELWLERKTWDDELDPDANARWGKISAALKSVPSVCVPRFIGTRMSHDKVRHELHCFVDASQKAYGAAVYLLIAEGDRRSVNLILSKARLAPMRQITLPRLELLAADIGRRLLAFVGEAVPANVRPGVHLWSDSQCVLYWIKSTKSLSVFVSNRVKKLREMTNVTFRYVPTDQNPADLVSRGCELSELKNNSFWWHGPKWLQSDKSEWPEFPDHCNIDPDTLERIRTEEKRDTLFEASLVATEDPSENTAIIDVSRYSSFLKLVRVAAWCLRFCRRVKEPNSRDKRFLNASELAAARKALIRQVQARHFLRVREAIERNEKHPLQRELGIWIDSDGILRCGGRLKNAGLSQDTVHPILLPATDWFTTLLIRYYHEKMLHSGVSHTLARIREEFWILRGRSCVYRCLKECKVCRRFQGGPYRAPQMPDLPEERVTTSPAFTFTGVDYLGPLHVKQGTATMKVWISLFTCMSTRAIHLEVVDSLSAADFLMCLRRFIGRRGTPSLLISDNAKQFKMSQVASDRLWKNAIMDESVVSHISANGIKWSFIPERAPWMGGFYERLVQSVKRALCKSVGQVCMTHVQLRTIMVEIEAMLNSRPLTYTGSDLKDGTALTPAHFLSLNPKIGVPNAAIPDVIDPDYVERMTSAESLLRSWHKGQRVLNSCWKVWKSEYLLNLRERQQRFLKQVKNSVDRAPEVGDIVHVRTESARGSWPLARVIKLIKSADGEVRSAMVRVSAGKCLRRAVAHLYPLEMPQKQGNVKDVKEVPLPERSDGTVSPAESTGKPVMDRPRRQAAVVARSKIRDMAANSENDKDEDDVLVVQVQNNNANQRSSKTGMSFGKVIHAPLLLSTILMMTLWTGANGLRPLLCEAEEAKVFFDLSITTRCPQLMTAPANVSTGHVQFFKRNIAKYTSIGYRCQKIKMVYSAWTNLFAMGWDHKLSTLDLEVSEQECHNMVNTRRCAEGPLLGSDDLAFTENKADYLFNKGFTGCCKWIDSEATNCFVTKGKVFQTFSGEMESNLGNVAGCEYGRKVCFLSNKATLIWEPVREASCEYVPWKRVSGKLWDGKFLDDDRELALTWKEGWSPKVELCGNQQGIMTDQGIPITYTIISRRLARFVTREQLEREYQKLLKEEKTDEVAPRLQALDMRLHEFFHEELNSAFMQVCHAMRRMQEIDLILAHSEPTLIARYLLNTTDIMARLTGKILEVWPCISVQTWTVKPMRERCFEFIPVNLTVRGKDLDGYLDPKTNIVYNNSAPIKCNLMEEVILESEDGSALLYRADIGSLEPYRGTIVGHPMYREDLVALADFKQVIHKPVSMYSLNELRAQSSLNDVFATVDHNHQILEKLADLSGQRPDNKDARSIMDNINRYTPWGILSQWISYLREAWIHLCCLLVTIRILWIICIRRCVKRRAERIIRAVMRKSDNSGNQRNNPKPTEEIDGTIQEQVVAQRKHDTAGHKLATAQRRDSFDTYNNRFIASDTLSLAKVVRETLQADK